MVWGVAVAKYLQEENDFFLYKGFYGVKPGSDPWY
jgi:hypothetical protein